MKYFIDIASDSLIKYGEELCGDKVEIIRQEDSAIIVLADGLGSGVKANILATITSKIAATMLREEAGLDETVDTIVNTLPVCKERNLAYSTFTIIKIHDDGRVYIVEYDNPPYFLISPNKNLNSKEQVIIDKKEIIIAEKLIKESTFVLEEDEALVIVSDGVIHAGIGHVLNLGWQWENVHEYLKKRVFLSKTAKNISKDLIQSCNNLYGEKPGDDTTVVAIRVRKAEVVDLFTGPPADKKDDIKMIKSFMKGDGKKVICGGTAANIAARELKRKLYTSIEYEDPNIPPIAYMEGIDLVTEGVLTMTKAVEIMKNYTDTIYESGCESEDIDISFKGKDGATLLAKLLIENCTHLNLWVGRAINPAHQNPDFPLDLSIKLKVVYELVDVMRSLGKEVKLNFI